jgi:hypothetical protein
MNAVGCIPMLVVYTYFAIQYRREPFCKLLEFYPHHLFNSIGLIRPQVYSPHLLEEKANLRVSMCYTSFGIREILHHLGVKLSSRFSTLIMIENHCTCKYLINHSTYHIYHFGKMAFSHRDRKDR